MERENKLILLADQDIVKSVVLRNAILTSECESGEGENIVNKF